MSAIILDGKASAEKWYQQAEHFLKQHTTLDPSLAVIVIGNDPATKIYVNNKIKACNRLGIRNYEYLLPNDCSNYDVISVIKQLNADESIKAIMLQLPLPPQLDYSTIINYINPDKDVEGVTFKKIGQLSTNVQNIVPCTPSGIWRLLQDYNIQLDNKHVVIVGRSNIVGKPLGMLLLNENATVTICHSHTPNLKEICKTADIFIADTGLPQYFTTDYIKDGAIVIDCGMDRNKENKLCGDVDFENVKEIATYITPVPGGVGKMTVAALMWNTVMCAIQWQRNQMK